MPIDDDELWAYRCWPTIEISRRVGLRPVTIRSWCAIRRVRAYKLGKNWYANLDDCMVLARQVRRRDPATGVVLPLQ